MKRKLIVFGLLCVVFCSYSLSYSGVPQMINYQGKITTPTGALIDNTLSMVFSIYPSQGDVLPAWAETLEVPVDKGIFRVVLGNVHAIPYNLFDGTVKYLGVKVGADPEMTPRKAIVSVGYAYKSEYSDTSEYARSVAGGDCGWVDDGSVVRLETGTDRVGIGTSTHPAKLSAMTIAGPAENEMAGYFKSTVGDNGTAIGVYGYAQVGTGGTAYGVVGQASGGESAWAAHFTGNLYASGDVGIGTETPSSKLDVDGDINTGNVYKIGDERVLSVPGSNTFVGINAGHNNTGSKNTFLGRAAGYRNTTGNRNTFLGDSAGYDNIGGHDNTFLGYQAGLQNSIGVYNTFVGNSAGRSNTTGESNTFVGIGAGRLNTEGMNNTFLGAYAGYACTTGHSNTFLGVQAGRWNTTGSHNAFLGDHAGYSNTTGHYNVFLGASAGRSNTTGESNTFLGWWAGYNNTEGVYNTFLGKFAGRSNTTGNSNTFLGWCAGYNDTTGNRNVFIGREAGYHETGSDKLYIANGSDDSDVLIYGDFSTVEVGIGTTDPQGALDVSSTTGALIVPRMTTAQRNDLTAVNGMIIYNITTNQFNFYENGAWVTK